MDQAPAFQFSARTPVALLAVGLLVVVGTAVAGGVAAPALHLSVLAALVRVAGRALVLEYPVGAGVADHAAIFPPTMRARLSLPLARYGPRSRRRSARWLARRRLRRARLDGSFSKKTKKLLGPDETSPEKPRLLFARTRARGGAWGGGRCSARGGGRETTGACDGRKEAVLARQAEVQLRGLQRLRARQGETQLRGLLPLLSRQAEGPLRGLQPLPAWQAQTQLRGLQPLPAWQGETQLRGLQPLPAWQAETRLRGLQPVPAWQAETAWTATPARMAS